MNPVSMPMAALVIGPACGLVAWAGFAMTPIEAALQSFARVGGLHFEIGRRTPFIRSRSDRPKPWLKKNPFMKLEGTP